MIQLFSASIKADIIAHVHHLGGSFRLGAYYSGAAGSGRSALIEPLALNCCVTLI